MSPASMAAASAERPVRVMIADDSAVVRGLVSRWLSEAAGVEVAAIAVDGAHALKQLAAANVDVCILDIEMPVLSGLEALPQLLAIKPGLKVIIASTLSERGADVTLRALQLGAADFIAKPTAGRLGGAEDYRRALVEKVLQFRPAARPVGAAQPPLAPSSPLSAAASGAPSALVIASSTGGPAALRRFFEQLGARWRAPVLIAQHMPAEFTPNLARLIDQVTPLAVAEGRNGEPVSAGRVYVAPGGYHMTVRKGATGGPVITLDQSPPINWCRPSADPLFESAAEVWGARAVGLVLTGMGHDGRDGARALRRRGGPIIVQDEATSVVWGMPGAVAAAGLADRVAPLDEIAPLVARMAGGAGA